MSEFSNERSESERNFILASDFDIAEQTALDESASPFVDGSTIVRGGESWRSEYAVRNDGRFITIAALDPASLGYYVPRTRSSGQVRDTSDTFLIDTTQMINNYPAVEGLFSVATDENRSALSCTMPTLATMYAFQQSRFQGLPIADVRPIQTGDNGNTGVRGYMEKLLDRHMAVAHDVPTYLHDTTTHWLGAATVHTEDFAAFLQLYADRQEIIAGDDASEAQFIKALGAGFDVSTGSTLQRLASGYCVPEDLLKENLLAFSLREMTWRCPPRVTEAALAKVAQMGMGMPEAYVGKNYTNYVVPWEAQNLPGHYRTVMKRLQE